MIEDFAKKSKMSSAYKLILCCAWGMWIPLMSGFWRMAAAKGSMKLVRESEKEREGESGHPCLVPLCSVKLCDVSPLVVTVAEGIVYKILIQLINDSPKPNFCNVVNKKFQLTLSKAFSASKVTIMVFSCCSDE